MSAFQYRHGVPPGHGTMSGRPLSGGLFLMPKIAHKMVLYSCCVPQRYIAKKHNYDF